MTKLLQISRLTCSDESSWPEYPGRQIMAVMMGKNDGVLLPEGILKGPHVQCIFVFEKCWTIIHLKIFQCFINFSHFYLNQYLSLAHKNDLHRVTTKWEMRPVQISLVAYWW